MEYRIAYDMLLGQRHNQEDCLLLADRVVQEEELDAVHRIGLESDTLLLAVCDGMGGHERGEWASRFVCENLREALPGLDPSPAGVRATLRGIQSRIEAAGRHGGGTTIAGVVLRGARTTVFNAGDSRVYRIAPEGTARLSHDHSLVQQLVDREEISADAAFSHPQRNVIAFGLGDIFAETWAAEEHEPHVTEYELSPGECLLLCSDGLHDALRDDELDRLLGPGPFERVEYLRDRLLGEIRDNTSYIIVGR